MASGVVVGTGVAAGGINNLVGVAISASLLPPVVNGGMCFAFALLGPTFYPLADPDADGGTSRSDDPAYTINRAALVITGAVSLALYCMNVAVILCVCIAVFKWKRVLYPDPFATSPWASGERFTRLAQVTDAVRAEGARGGWSAGLEATRVAVAAPPVRELDPR